MARSKNDQATRPRVVSLIDELVDLPCPWCNSPTHDADLRCPSCARTFG